jgi:hypothetical protein
VIEPPLAPLGAFFRRLRHGRGGGVVELARHAAGATSEAFVEGVRRNGDYVEVAVMLADGSDATARLGTVEWDWMGHRPGDIVLVRRARWPVLSV